MKHQEKTPQDLQEKQSPQVKLTLLKGNKPAPVTCYHCGGTKHRKNGRNRATKTQIYQCLECNKQFTPPGQDPLSDVLDEDYTVNPASEYEKDVWDCRRLGIDAGVGKSSYKLSFADITQAWMKAAAKLHIKTCLSHLAFSSVQEKMYSLRKLSAFLEEAYPGLGPAGITRGVITEYTVYLAGKGLAEATRCKILHDAKLFFDVCYQNEWLNVSRYLVRPEDVPKIPKRAPRYIPEEVCSSLMSA